MNLLTKLKMVAVAVLLLVAINSADGGAANQDDYITESQNACFQSHDTLSCFKYRTLRYMSGMAVGNAWLFQSDAKDSGNVSTRGFTYDDGTSILKLVKIEKPFIGQDGEEFLAESRQMSNDSELDKFVKFGKRQARNFLTSHGIRVGLPDGATAVNEDDQSIDNDIVESPRKNDGRGKKKKLAILFPLLSLLSILKVKLLLVPILLTVLFIKKILVLAALFLPTILSTLKICKVNQPHPHHSQWTGAEQSSDYSSGYGGYSAYAGPVNQGHQKEWAASRAYSAYRPTYEGKQMKSSASDYLPSGSNVIYPPTANNQA